MRMRKKIKWTCTQIFWLIRLLILLFTQNYSSTLILHHMVEGVFCENWIERVAFTRLGFGLHILSRLLSLSREHSY